MIEEIKSHYERLDPAQQSMFRTQCALQIGSTLGLMEPGQRVQFHLFTVTKAAETNIGSAWDLPAREDDIKEYLYQVSKLHIVDVEHNAFKDLFVFEKRQPRTQEEEEYLVSQCTNPNGHQFEYTGTAYGGDDERYHGEGRCYCIHCGADGDA